MYTCNIQSNRLHPSPPNIVKGGLKAVVWTDVVQTIIMLGAMLLIIVKGTIDIGGPGVVFSKAKESGRLELPK